MLTVGGIEGHAIEPPIGYTWERHRDIDERGGFTGGTVIRKTFMYISWCGMCERDSAGIRKLAHIILVKFGGYFRYHVNIRGNKMKTTHACFGCLFGT